MICYFIVCEFGLRPCLGLFALILVVLCFVVLILVCFLFYLLIWYV